MEFDQTLKSWRQTFELFFQKRSQMWGPKSLLSSEPVYWFALSIPYRKWSHTLCPKREISYDILVKHAYQLLLLHAGSWWSTKFTCLILSDFGDIVAKSFSFVSFRTSSFTWSNHHLPPPFATTICHHHLSPPFATTICHHHLPPPLVTFLSADHLLPDIFFVFSLTTNFNVGLKNMW